MAGQEGWILEEKKTFLQRLDKNITLPTDIIGAVVFLAFAVFILLIMPQQVTVSDKDVVNGRAFPTLLMGLMIICCVILLVQALVKWKKKQPQHTVTINLLTELRALIILAILFATWWICRITDLFLAGAIFCALAFLVYFRCKKVSYYIITVGAAVLIWVAFRYGLNVRF